MENGVEDYNTQIVREPFNLEFFRQEINYFISLFYGYIAGYFESIKLILPSQCFMKKVDSNLVLYGSKDSKYFEEEYNSQEAYQAAIQAFESNCTNPWKPQNVNTILETIVNETLGK